MIFILFNIFITSSVRGNAIQNDPLNTIGIHQFCANNQLLTFSSKQCPGGILLKEPMELTQPCHCVNQHLTIYEACSRSELSSDFQYPSKICRQDSSQNKKSALIKLIQPSELNWNISASSPKCQIALSSCTPLLSNSFPTPHKSVSHYHHTIGYDHEHRRHRHFHDYHQNQQHHHHHRHKRDVYGSKTYDQTLMKRVQETFNFLNQLQSGSAERKQPKSMSLQTLAKTVEIFNRIAPSSIVQDDTLVGILTLFLEKYPELEYPGISGNLAVDNLLDLRTFDEVMTKLEECSSKAGDPNQEFQFIIKPDSCPAVTTHYTYKVNMGNYGTKKIKAELGKLMPKNRKYIPNEEDFVLGVLWKVFDAVYSYCYPYIFTFHSGQIYVNFYNIISNIFSFPSVFKDFKSKDGEGTIMYASRIDHDDLILLMKNIESMNEAIHIVSKAKQFFLKPQTKPSPGGGSNGPPNPDSKPEPTQEEEEAENQANPFRHGKRHKRSVEKEIDWKQHEIWNGKAYCLQLADQSVPPSLFNTYPRVENICTDGRI